MGLPRSTLQHWVEKNKNAREGIETRITPMTNTTSSSLGGKNKNAREGIETVCSGDSRLGSELRGKNKNAREGIETTRPIGAGARSLPLWKKQKCPRGH